MMDGQDEDPVEEATFFTFALASIVSCASLTHRGVLGGFGLEYLATPGCGYISAVFIYPK
jgi:hypothetical protein